MEKPNKFLLPSPVFNKKKDEIPKSNLHFLTPSGMTLLPRAEQPPPMYGPRGSTVPAKYLQQRHQQQKHYKPSTEKPSPQTIKTPVQKHACDSCEMTLQSFEDLQFHNSQHLPCPVDSCTFLGHATVMDKHVIRFHSSELGNRVKRLATPEEIAEWREERRKKYPTAANVRQLQLATEQRNRRGERLEAYKRRFGRPEDCRRTRKHTIKAPHKTNKREYNNNQEQNKRKFDIPKKEKTINATTVKNNCSAITLMFRGTSQMEDYEHVIDTTKEKEVNALTSIVGLYGSDSDSNSNSDSNSDSEIEENNLTSDLSNSNQSNNKDDHTSTSQPTSVPMEQTDVIECMDQEDSNALILNADDNVHDSTPLEQSDQCSKVECGPLTNVISSTVENANDMKAKENSNSSDEAPYEEPIARSSDLPLPTPKPMPIKPLQERKIWSGLDYRKLRLRKQNTMLEKLLEMEMRHERNVLLQCVRYVCENNFFNIGSNQNNKL